MFFQREKMRTTTILLIVFAMSVLMANCASNKSIANGVNPKSTTEIGTPIFVYEQIELMSLVLRLAGYDEYGEISTLYQQSLEPAFSEFLEHPIIEYARELRNEREIGYDAPIVFAVHLEKIGEHFQFMAGSTIWEEDNRWTQEIADRFLELLNDFYLKSNFKDFFQTNIPYYAEHSQRLADELMSQINFDWFYQFGFIPEHLKIAISPSSSRNGYGPTVLNTYNYAVLPVSDNYGDNVGFVVHEFAHSFANPIAEAWYEENDEFKELSDNSVDPDRLPYYPKGIIMAREYVTRAYTILYLTTEHEENLVSLLLGEINEGFTFIETVYAMITEHELIFTPEFDTIAFLFGKDVEYTLGEEKEITMGEYVFYLQDVYLKEIELQLESFSHSNNGNAFNSQAGDIFILTFNGSKALYIDLGPNPLGETWGLPAGALRKYHVFPIFNM